MTRDWSFCRMQSEPSEGTLGGFDSHKDLKMVLDRTMNEMV